jgi:hypothetical protein
MFGDPPEASLLELANYPLEASRTRIPRLLAATNTQGSPRIIATDPPMPLVDATEHHSANYLLPGASFCSIPPADRYCNGRGATFRLAAACERLDDDHAAAALLRTWVRKALQGGRGSSRTQ